MHFLIFNQIFLIPPLSLYWYHFDVMVVDIPPYCHKKSYQNLKFDLGLDVGFDVDVGVGMGLNVDLGVDVELNVGLYVDVELDVGLYVDVELDVGLARQILKPQY